MKKATGRRPCEDGDRDSSDSAVSQGTPRHVSHHQKHGRRKKTDSPSEPLQRTNLCQHLQTVSLQNCDRIISCCFKVPTLRWFVMAVLEMRTPGFQFFLPAPFSSLFCLYMLFPVKDAFISEELRLAFTTPSLSVFAVNPKEKRRLKHLFYFKIKGS